MLKAGRMLTASLYCIPSFTHGFLRYLWNTLVFPVAVYGMAVYNWRPTEAERFNNIQITLLRSLLRVGGRSPQDVLEVLMYLTPCAKLNGEWPGLVCLSG